MADAAMFPELDDECSQLAHARDCRAEMIAMFERVDPQDSANEFTKEYIEVTVRLDDSRSAGVAHGRRRSIRRRVVVTSRRRLRRRSTMITGGSS